MKALATTSPTTPHLRVLPFSGELVDGKYRIELPVGQGGMGLVYLASHRVLGQRVAIKFLRPSLRNHESMLERFSHEARAASKLRTEHAATVYDVGVSESHGPYIVMEYLEGEDLSQMLRREGPMPLARVIDIALQACAGLAAAHDAGVFHHDVKPSNLYATRRADGSMLVKVLDFGVSTSSVLREADEGSGARRRSGIVGSPSYMAPEQIRGVIDADGHADVWAMGIVMHELLTGRCPFDGATLEEQLHRVCEGDPEPVHATRPDVPAALQAVVSRCLRKAPNQRFASMRELASALRPFASAHATPSAEISAELIADEDLEAHFGLRKKRGGPSGPWIIVPVVMLLAALLAIAVAYFVSHRSVPRRVVRRQTEASISHRVFSPLKRADEAKQAEPVAAASNASSASIAAPTGAVASLPVAQPPRVAAPRPASRPEPSPAPTPEPNHALDDRK